METVPNAPTTIGTNFYVLVYNFTFFYFYTLILWDGKFHKTTTSFFPCTLTLSLLGKSVCFSKSERILCEFFSRTVVVCSNFNFLFNSQWITFLYAVKPRIVLLLCEFSAFAYYVIHRFIFFSALAQFLVNNLSYPFMPRIVLLLC